MISTDLTGSFPITSARWHKYIFVLYDYDSNAILAEPIFSRKKWHILAGYKACYTHLHQAGIQPIMQRLDNETSDILIAEIQANNLDYKYEASGDHQLNPVERAIQTFKNHLISILNGADTTFLENQWDRLIYVATITLGMLRTSIMNPKLSSYMQLWGNFDFKKTPLAPTGCKASIHERANKRGTWAKHGKWGYFVSPAMHHYRNYRLYIPKTHSESVSNTVQFFPKHPIPKSSSTERIVDTVKTLTTMVKNPHVPEPFTDNSGALTATIDAL